MFVETVKRPYKGKTYTAVLLRHTYREDGKVKHKTLANLSALPAETIDLIRRSLKGETLVSASELLRITASRAHGGVWAVFKVAERLGLAKLLGSKHSPWHNLVLAMVIARIIRPGSKRFSSSWVDTTTLPRLLDMPAGIKVNDLYEAMDALLQRQPAIEKALADRHLGHGTLVLYDLSSTYLEGRCCPLAAFGHNRDGKRGKKQFTYGLLTNNEGCPVSIEVFSGNTADPSTLTSQIEKLRDRFGFDRIVVAGDRGMITSARIEELKKAGYDWITALRAKAIQSLHEQGSIQLGMFDEQDIAEIWDSEYGAERLVVCRNPQVAEDRARTRQELLEATEQQLLKIKARVDRGTLKEIESIGVAVGRVIDRFKVAKHFEVKIEYGRLTYSRNEGSINREAALDGIYVIRTSIDDKAMSPAEVVDSYKRLKHVEHAFRSMKTMHLELRPVFHRLSDRVRAHAFLCMLAYYILWHMEKGLTGLRNEDPRGFGSLKMALEELQTIQLNTIMVGGKTFEQVTEPNEKQLRILAALGVNTLL